MRTKYFGLKNTILTRTFLHNEDKMERTTESVIVVISAPFFRSIKCNITLKSSGIVSLWKVLDERKVVYVHWLRHFRLRRCNLFDVC